MSVPVTSDVGLLRRNRALLALGFSPLFASAALFAVGMARADQSEATSQFFSILASLLSLCAGLISSAYVVFANPKRVAVAGQLVIGEAAVDFAGARIARRRSLRAGFILPRHDSSPLLRLERRWPRAPIDLVLRDEEQGSELLRALGLDASQGVVELVLASRVHANQLSVGVIGLGWIFFAMIAALSLKLDPDLATKAWLAVVGLALTAWMVAVSRSTRVIVGADGLFVRWLWSTRFVPLRELREVQPYTTWYVQGVGLELASGARVHLPIRAKYTEALTSQEIDRVGHRIQQALDLFRKRQSADEVRLPERGGRDDLAWIRALRAAGSGAASDHRTAPTPPDALWRIVEDPAVEPLGRAAAAIALSAELDAPGKERLRRMIEVTAEPDFRGLLEATAEEADEERLSRALSRVTKG
jgi:hypothetical protein